MNIVGNKVILRAIEERDRDLLFDLINDPEIEKMIGGASFPVSVAEQEQWMHNQVGNRNTLRCIIAEKGNDENGLGTIILSDIDYKNGTAQVHIKIKKDEGQGKGYGTDALKTLTGYAFSELRLNCIYATVLSYNTRSQHLFEKCGFIREGIMRARVFKDAEYIDVISYSLVKAD